MALVSERLDREWGYRLQCSFDVSFDQQILGFVLSKVSDAAEYTLLVVDEGTGVQRCECTSPWRLRLGAGAERGELG